MQIFTHSIDEFIRCLDHESSLFGGALRVSTIRNPIDGTKRTAIRFDVVFSASAVILNGEDQYLLRSEQSCGVDYEDSSNDSSGSCLASSLSNKIKSYADGRGWKVLPGIISE